VTRRSILFLIGALAALAASPGPAHAVDASGTAASRKETFPLGGYFLLEHSLGAGTFIDHPYERKPSYSMTFVAMPWYYFTDLFSLRARIDISKEFVSNADSTTTINREVTLSDFILTAAYGSFYRVPKDVPVVGGLNLAGNLDVLFPTSKQSQFRTMITAVRPSLVVVWPFGTCSFNYWLRVQKNFNRYTSPVVSTSDGTPVAVARLRGAEELAADLIAVGGNNVEWAVTNRAYFTWNISNTFSFGHDLTLWIEYSLTNSWTYRSYPDDELKAASAKAGRGRRDVETGIVELFWQVAGPFYMNFGISSYQPPKTADNGGFRVPFLNFWDLANNYTSLFLDLVVMF